MVCRVEVPSLIEFVENSAPCGRDQERALLKDRIQEEPRIDIVGTRKARPTILAVGGSHRRLALLRLRLGLSPLAASKYTLSSYLRRRTCTAQRSSA